MSDSDPHVLYIDDDEGLRRLLSRALARRGFQVSVAESGVRGVEMAKQGGFDLISIDHYMPGQDGLATLQALQAEGPCPPVVYVTGSEETQIAVAALKAGAADYIVKSVGEDFVDLLASTYRQTLEKERLKTAKEEVEQELRAANARLEALLREVNHRVANGLQLVSAFVHMQAGLLKDAAARTALLETQQRIGAIAQVHRRLYASGDVNYVNMDEYLAALVTELQQTCSTPQGPRDIRLSAEPLKLPADDAISLGVIVNELVTNACKYAYAPSEPGQVRVTLTTADAAFELAVEDDGQGLPADGSIQGTGLGTKLIKAMIGSLQASISYVPAPRGVRAVVRGRS